MMRPSKSTIVSQFVFGAALLWLLGTFSPVAVADPPIEYRRVLVPADQPAAWPREGEKFLPVESRDFDAWIAAANRPPAEASLADAEYHRTSRRTPTCRRERALASQRSAARDRHVCRSATIARPS